MKQSDIEKACDLAQRLLDILPDNDPEVVRLAVFIIIKAFRATYGGYWEDNLIKNLEDQSYVEPREPSG